MKIKSIIGLLILLVCGMFTSNASVDKASNHKLSDQSIIGDNQACLFQEDIDPAAMLLITNNNSSNVCVLSGSLFIPIGSITYVKIDDCLYETPYVYTGYVWDTQHMYNC